MTIRSLVLGEFGHMNMIMTILGPSRERLGFGFERLLVIPPKQGGLEVVDTQREVRRTQREFQ